MDYEKAYKEALERARKIKHDIENAGCSMSADMLDIIFPELSESEDERIRKEIIGYLTHRAEVTAFIDETKDCERWIAWLEKQKEQKPNIELIQKSWYLEGYHDGKYNNEPKWLIQTGKGGPRYEENPKYGTQKPAEWSEEDEKMRGNLMSLLANMRGDRITEETYQKYYPWLKSLRPHRLTPVQKTAISRAIFLASGMNEDSLAEELKRIYDNTECVEPIPHWKPTEEQIDALEHAITHLNYWRDNDDVHVNAVKQLTSLLDKLKLL